MFLLHFSEVGMLERVEVRRVRYGRERRKRIGMTILAPCKLLRGRGERLGPSLGGPLAFASLGGSSSRKSQEQWGSNGPGGGKWGAMEAMEAMGEAWERQVIPVLYYLGKVGTYAVSCNAGRWRAVVTCLSSSNCSNCSKHSGQEITALAARDTAPPKRMHLTA